ncbi:MAG: TM2 domain-containing protein [Melioribacteraceae bacterium]|nr:TM2 domain-containing protein [Melioribacteraceae bacterium]
MANILDLLPELVGEEQAYVAGIIRDMDDDKARQFSNAYRARRREPQTILLLALLGFLWIAGIQRFVTDQIGMGILYFFTLGFCFIGTIIDMVNYKKLAFEYNIVQAQQIVAVMR